MLKCCLLILIPCLFLRASAQNQQSDSGAFLLHKFEQKIGRELYTVSSTANGISYNIGFKFTDRGKAVPLQAAYYCTKAGEPKSFWIKGNTSRFSTIADSVVIANGKAFVKVDDAARTINTKGPFFPVAGYAPGTIQMLLIDYWEKHRQPSTIQMLPAGTVQISRDGHDTLHFRNKALRLNRYVIKGLIWGNELVWTDEKGSLICLITNDAEGDKIEMMSEPHEELLSTLIQKAAVYGMRLFTQTAGAASTTLHPLIALTGGDVANVLDGTVQKNTTVLIRNGKITGIGTNTVVPKDAFVVSAKGKTVLPGLWDMHAHFEQAEWGPAYLAAGITTVRDCGGEFGYINTVKEAIDGNRGIGPHILKAGFIDGKGPRAAGIIQVDTKEEAIKEVKHYKDAGFVQMKIYSSVKPGMVKAICDEAHKQGMTVTGHIPTGMTVQQGVDSGMDMVNHIQYITRMMKVEPKAFTVDLNDSLSKAAFAYLKQHRVVVDPTLVVYELSGRSTSENITDMEPAFYTLPPALQTLFVSTGVSDSADIAFYKAFLKANQQIVKRLVDEGIPVVAGTDMGMPGFSLYRELELYVNAGLTPLQAIQSATVVPATVMKMDKQTGSLEVGKDADLILVDGNPFQNIKDIRKVSAVIKSGRLYSPVQLHKQAGFLH